MSDDVKKALEDLRYIASQFGLKTVGEPPFVVRIKDLRALLEERDALHEALKKMGCQRRHYDGRRAPVCGEDPRDVDHGDADWALCPVCRLTMPDRVERVQQQAFEARERRKSRAEQKMRGGK